VKKIKIPKKRIQSMPDNAHSFSVFHWFFDKKLTLLWKRCQYLWQNGKSWYTMVISFHAFFLYLFAECVIVSSKKKQNNV